MPFRFIFLSFDPIHVCFIPAYISEMQTKWIKFVMHVNEKTETVFPPNKPTAEMTTAYAAAELPTNIESRECSFSVGIFKSKPPKIMYDLKIAMHAAQNHLKMKTRAFRQNPPTNPHETKRITNPKWLMKSNQIRINTIYILTFNQQMQFAFCSFVTKWTGGGGSGRSNTNGSELIDLHII